MAHLMLHFKVPLRVHVEEPLKMFKKVTKGIHLRLYLMVHLKV